ncbi:MAG: hypothetical protein WC829_06720 [Hyphomicrobium sp.]
MSIFTVRQGRRYRASIALGLLERLAGNDVIAERLRDAGFTDVNVTGSGAERLAVALWPSEDATAEMPNQIKAVTEIEAA